VQNAENSPLYTESLRERRYIGEIGGAVRRHCPKPMGKITNL